MAYNERFVAFLDILGFKNLIDYTKDNPEYQEKIIKVLNYIASLRSANYYGFLSEYGIMKEVSVFSDSIVISYSSGLNIGGALFHVLMDLVYICNNLFAENIYVRGGIICGKMYHDKKVCFGPAMIQAYTLEENIAIYPRIVIDSVAIRRGLELLGQANTVEEEAEYLEGLLCCDKDGIYYLDFLSQYQEFDDSYYYKCFLDNVKTTLISHLKAGYPNRIAEEYLWFAEYYNKTIMRVYNEYPPSALIDLIHYK